MDFVRGKIHETSHPASREDDFHGMLDRWSVRAPEYWGIGEDQNSITPVLQYSIDEEDFVLIRLMVRKVLRLDISRFLSTDCMRLVWV